MQMTNCSHLWFYLSYEITQNPTDQCAGSEGIWIRIRCVWLGDLDLVWAGLGLFELVGGYVSVSLIRILLSLKELEPNLNRPPLSRSCPSSLGHLLTLSEIIYILYPQDHLPLVVDSEVKPLTLLTGCAIFTFKCACACKHRPQSMACSKEGCLWLPSRQWKTLILLPSIFSSLGSILFDIHLSISQYLLINIFWQ